MKSDVSLREKWADAEGGKLLDEDEKRRATKWRRRVSRHGI